MMVNPLINNEAYNSKIPKIDIKRDIQIFRKIIEEHITYHCHKRQLPILLIIRLTV